MVGRALGTARWMTGLHKGVPEGDSFSSLPHAILGRGVGTAMLSTLEVAARLGTLNAVIPSLSKVAWERKI